VTRPVARRTIRRGHAASRGPIHRPPRRRRRPPGAGPRRGRGGRWSGSRATARCSRGGTSARTAAARRGPPPRSPPCTPRTPCRPRPPAAAAAAAAPGTQRGEAPRRRGRTPRPRGPPRAGSGPGSMRGGTSPRSSRRRRPCPSSPWEWMDSSKRKRSRFFRRRKDGEERERDGGAGQAFFLRAREKDRVFSAEGKMEKRERREVQGRRLNRNRPLFSLFFLIKRQALQL
jgi:hypothetical protein